MKIFYNKIDQVVEKLMTCDNISLEYRTLTELMDLPEDHPDIIKLKSLIPESEPVKQIMAKMHPDGYWLQKNYKGEIHGDGVVYGSFATTHFCLAYLAELGMTKDDARIEKACDRYLNLQNDDGDWWMHLSCLNGYNINSFIKLGYEKDSRLQKNIDLMLNTKRHDGGYLCELHEKYGKKKKKKSCVRGSSKMLLAFSSLPKYYDHVRVKELVNYFLDRGGIFKRKHPDQPVNKDMPLFTFPITWRSNSWEILLALSKMGYGKDRRLENAWQLVLDKRNPDGSFNLDYVYKQIPYSFGKVDKPNPWITFYILLAMKYAGMDVL